MKSKVRSLGPVGICGLLVSMLLLGCTLEAPVDPSNLFGSVGDNIQNIARQIQDAVADPLGNKPFPVLVGGDSERIFYGTNLGDVRINFPGPTNDLVIPGFFGPSNLYVYEGNQRELIRAFLGTGLFGSFSTDGEYVVYVAGPEGRPFGFKQLIVDYAHFADRRVVFDAADVDPNAYLGNAVVDEGRVAFFAGSGYGDNPGRLIIADLTTETTREVAEGYFWTFDLHRNLLAYERSTDDAYDLLLLDLSTDETTTLASGLAASTFIGSVYITDNMVVWSELPLGGSLRIVAHDPATGETTVWADAVSGQLVGATDDQFLIQEYVLGNNGFTERIQIRLYGADGSERKLADFRADGLAGQAQIMGDRAVFVNPDRRIVVVPLTDGDRFNFRPF